MKNLLYVAVILAVVSSYATAQTEEHHEPPAPTVTDEHKMLHKEVGTWDAEMKMWMAGPDAEPMEMAAVETNTLMDGGLWIISEFESGPFKGHGQFGYDPIEKKFVGTWIDNMNPHLGVMKGTIKDNGEMVMFTKGYNPHTHEAEKMKSVSKWVSDNEKEFTMYKQSASGDWVKSMEIMYKRRES